ncbi:MAG: CxxxxCH/CxxCH domain-containing protein [Holophagaceae bacterium]|nr:CxxxxCH/CxxCH domain-containing protein [Holophagaceae bacterium]
MKHALTSLHMRIFGAVLLLIGSMLACSRGDQTRGAGPSQNGHFHPADWISIHPGKAMTPGTLGGCKECHEMTVTRTGSGIPSCMTADCHHKPVPGWALAGSHGAKAKLAQDASGGGMASCQLCHGTDFGGGVSTNSCESCHTVKAPHPVKPWRNSAGTTHTNTDPSNAAVCAQCHFPGSAVNPPNHPPVSPAAGSAPGCFNNTLCHGEAAAPHALGSVWLEPTSQNFHGLQAKQDLLYCQSCHGTPGTPKFDGGSASTKCSSCHTAAKAHSKPWHPAPVATFPGYVPSHRNAGKRDTSCSVCHDYTKGRTAPLIGAPSCYSAAEGGVGCHANGPGQANHAVPYLEAGHTAVTQTGFNSNCSSCHAVAGASPLSSAPLCSACHQAGSPLTQGSCASCHAKPPTGSVFPNVAGTHAKHDALSGLTGQCAACHSGSDSGSLLHYNHANGRSGHDSLRTAPGETSFLATFNSKSGSASFDPTQLTCSNVSCHGGKTTPNWQNGIIDVNSEAGCQQCHVVGTAVGTPENNSAYSGLHAVHMAAKAGAACVDCHAMGNSTAGAQNHFKFLNTPQMEGPASSTIAPQGNPSFYNIPTQTCGNFVCHGQQHTNYSWIGGANHAVPFLDSAHFTASQSGFDANCKNCHSDTGSSPIAAAPLCSTCHQASSVLTVSNCASCHTKPPTGAAFPNVAGKHGKHDALDGVAGVCSSCHTGSDSTTLSHYDHANARPGKDALRVPPAPTAFMSVYNAKSGSASFNPATLTCSSVSCHGGQSASSWQTGTIDPNADAGCRQCHALGTSQGVPQYNSLFSGLHAKHLGTEVNALCTECHIMSNGTAGAQNHFKFLNTTQMEGPAGSTVAPLGNPAFYNIPAQTCGTFTCHGTQHGNFSWTGGPNHAVPFLSPDHTSVTQGGYDADCKTCHAVSGTSPLASAPLCSSCHQGGSPLTISNCASCHAEPPTGSVFPNIAGTHATHDSLQGVTGACNTCHSNSGTTTQLHYDHANGRPGHDALRVPPGEVQTLSTYNAKTGAASFNTAGLTCSNVSCHGGQTTPNWQTGSINVDTQCASCHVRGTTQFNSYNSGEHKKHVVDEGIACVECHNTTTLAVNHFTTLGTSAMEGPASATIGGGATAIPAGAWNATNKTCTFNCHGQENHNNEQW